MTAPDLTSWLKNLESDSEIFLHQLDLLSDRALLVKLSVEEIRQASFLDQRVLTAQTAGAWLPWSDVYSHAEAIEFTPPQYIFHVGHCGSTLLSRLLNGLAPVRCLREPMALRPIAEERLEKSANASFWDVAELQNRLLTLTRIWSKGDQQTIIKATSICTNLMQDVMTLHQQTKVCFMSISAGTYLSALLGGANAFADLRGFAQLRVRRLNHLLNEGVILSDLSLGQLTALSWLTETVTACHVQDMIDADQRIHFLDFDLFLKNQDQQLVELARHFGITAPEEKIQQVLGGQTMTSYSKAQEHPYDAAIREQVLDQSRQAHATEISSGLNWLDMMAGKHQLAARALNKFNTTG